MSNVSHQSKSKIVVPNQPNARQRILALLLSSGLKGLDRSIRFSWKDHTGGLLDGPRNESVIFCIWHNRLALCMAIYRHYVRPKDPTRRLAALISASRDGAFLAEALRRFDVQAVRGSTSRRGPQSLLELARWLRKRHDVAITPDGPRGPAYRVQEGVAALARVSGAAIIPVGCRLSRKFELKSWDRFQVPMPFARCEVTFDPPFHVPSHTPKEKLGDFREELQARLMALES